MVASAREQCTGRKELVHTVDFYHINLGQLRTRSHLPTHAYVPDVPGVRTVAYDSGKYNADNPSQAL